jgi:hypothetical protein
VHRDALHIAGRGTPSTHVFAELRRHRNRPAIAIDADEDELRAGNKGIVSNPPRALTHREAGAAVMGEHLLKTKHIAGEGGGPIVDDRFAQRRPGAAPREHVHARATSKHLPASPLEQTEE